MTAAGSPGWARMAETLLRGVGGQTVTLRVPGSAIAGDVGEQVGLAGPQFQDLALGPVAFRKVRPTVNEGQAAGFELLVSAYAVETLVGSLDFDSAAVLFRNAAGVLVDGAEMQIVSSSAVSGAGGVCLYRLLLRSRVTAEV